MALVFDSRYYLQNNPDVAAAISRGAFASAEEHFNLFGRFESRDPNAFFDTSFYLSEYPDVAAAGVNPFAHFLAFGALEDRFTNDTAASLLDTDGDGFANEFDAEAYLEANPDVADAGVDAYAHFIRFGQFEGRTAPLTNGQSITGPLTNTGTAPGTGNTFTLTSELDQLVGTSANDTFQGTTANLGDFDSIDGAGGSNTLNLFGSIASASDTGVSIRNIQTVNLSGNAAAVDATYFGSAAQQIWQIQAAGDVSELAVNQTAGFRNVALDTTAGIEVAAADGAASANIALDNVGGEAITNAVSLGVSGESLSTVNLSGTIVQTTTGANTAAATVDLTVGLGEDVTNVVINSAFNADVTLNVTGNSPTSFASTGTGGITVGLTGADFADLTTATFGAGADDLTIDLGDVARTVNLGAGNDVIRIDGTAGTENVALAVTLGAGSDTVEITALANIFDASEDAFAAGIISITDFNAGRAGDVLDISGLALTFETLIATEVSAIDQADSLFAAVTLAASYVDFANGSDAVAFDYDGNAYILATTDADFDTTDGLLQLTGVSVTQLTASNYLTA